MLFVQKRAYSLTAAAFAAIFLFACSGGERSDVPADQADSADTLTDSDSTQYVGVERCTQCHAQESADWSRSHHAGAMAPANAQTVLGDFDDRRFEYGDLFAEFFMREGEYWYRTNDLPRQSSPTVAGPDPAPPSDGIAEFEVEYTFGFEPLQQYLVATAAGQLQALNIAWSADPQRSGWFDLYEGQLLPRDDPLQWSGELHTWNSRCATCHVTAFAKNFDTESGTYASTWAAVNVGCEACHGPGSIHARQPATPMPVGTRIDTQWAFSESPIASRIGAGAGPEGLGDAQSQAEACAACHSRRAQLADWEAGTAYLDAFEPAMLTAGLYHADGQILDEVFVYGSFVQSAMHAAGVACTDCHNPHSGELRAAGDALCAGCHRADVFAVAEHHRHSATVQPECVDCHMPATTYMQVDPRRDHSFRVPRPDLSQSLDTPNACNSCHAEQDAAWAQSFIEQWFPEGRWRDAHYAEALHAGRTWSAERLPRLLEVVYDESLPSIVRGTAVILLARQLDGAALDAVEFAARSSDPWLQLAALQSLENADDTVRVQLGQRFLDDDLRVFRVNAARALTGAQGQLSERRREDFAAAQADYANTFAYNADSAEGRLGIGLMADRRGDLVAAEREYRAAIARNPAFSAAYINLADLLRRGGDERQASATLAAALEAAATDDPALHAALGLSQVRLGDREAALQSLARAAELAPEDPFHVYTYGVALASIRTPEAAIEYLEAASVRMPGHVPILFAIATMNRDAGRIDAAREYTRRLLEVSPGNPLGVSLQRELDARP